MNSSLSQGVAKRFNGKAKQDARIEDIRSRSTYRHHSDTGCCYSIVNRFNQIVVEFAQTGERHNMTRTAIVGELTTQGFKSHSTIAVESQEFSWDELAELIGMNPHTLMKSVLKFAKSQQYVACQSSRDRYGVTVGNRRKQDKAARNMKGIRIC